MPPLKPGRWSVSPALVAPEWRGLWRGLQFALCPSGRNSFDPIHRQLGVPGSNPPDAGISPFGPSIVVKQSATSNLTYSNVEYDGADGPVSFAALVMVDGTDTANDNIIGFATADTANCFLRTNSTPTLRMSIRDTQASVNISRNVWYFAVGRYEGGDTDYKRIDVYYPDGSFFDSHDHSTQGSGNVPAAGTPLTIGEITGSGLGGADLDIPLALYWDRYLTDAEVAQLVRDPFGLLRRDDLEVLPFTQPVQSLTDDFTGTNGDPLDPTKWRDDSNPSSTAEIQSNMGELQTVGGTRARIWSPEISPPDYLDAVFQVALEDNTSDIHVGFMTEGRWDRDGDNGPIPDDALYLKIEHGINQFSNNQVAPVYGGTGTDQAQGQAFTTGGALDVYGVAVGLQVTGSPADNISVRIRETSMTGSIIATSTAKGAATVFSGLNVFSFSGVSLSSSTQYYLEVYRSGGRDTSNYISVQYYDTSDIYTGGNRWKNDSGSWAEQTSEDARFSVGLPNLRRSSSSGNTILGPFGVAAGTTWYWWRLRYDGTYLWCKQWQGTRADEPSIWFAQSADTVHADATHWRFFASANPGGYCRIDNVEVGKALLNSKISSVGSKKPGPWSFNLGMVRPEWRNFWRNMMVAVPFWEAENPTEISGEGGPMAFGGTNRPTWVASPFGSFATFDTSAQGGWTTNANGPGFPTSGGGENLAYIGLNQADDISTDEESIFQCGMYLRIELDGSISISGAADSNSPAGFLNAGDYFLWMVRQTNDGQFVELLAYNYTTGVFHRGTPDSNAIHRPPEPVELGHRSTNDYTSRMGVFYCMDRFVLDEEWERLLVDPFGPLRMDMGGPEVWAPLTGTPFTIDPDGDGTITGIFNELGGVTNLYQSVDDDPDTPTLTDWNTSGEADGSTFYTLGATPGDFDSINTPLTIRVYLDSTDFAADTAVLYAQVFAADESTAYTNEVSVGTQASSGLVTADMTVNATGLAANKAAWDAARIRLRWDYTA